MSLTRQTLKTNGSVALQQQQKTVSRARELWNLRQMLRGECWKVTAAGAAAAFSIPSLKKQAIEILSSSSALQRADSPIDNVPYRRRVATPCDTFSGSLVHLFLITNDNRLPPPWVRWIHLSVEADIID